MNCLSTKLKEYILSHKKSLFMSIVRRYMPHARDKW